MPATITKDRKVSKPRIGLVTCDTETYVLANNAIHASVSRFDVASVRVFTDRPDLWPQCDGITIPKLANIDDYNRVILERLPERMTEDFSIVCQYDGFILNPEQFSRDFYDYDYIGAVWPNYPYFCVGNGGFSWRSRRLAEAVAELASIRAPGEAEDLFICRSLRVILEERYGCRFADEATAQRFSYEILPGGEAAFGFHGVFNLPLVYRESLEFLVDNLPRRILETRMEFLRFGARQLGPERAAEFERLVARALARMTT